MAENTKIKISGRCETDDIESCVFTIRRVGKSIRAHGYKELADALESAVGKLTKRKAKVGEEAGMGYAKGYLPKEIDVYPNTIEKHYVAKESCQRRTFRVIKDGDILAYICCAKGDKMVGKKCHPKPTLHKTVVPNNEKYKKKLEDLLRVHSEIPVHYHKTEGVEAREPLTVTNPVVGEEHSVSIPLVCGTKPVPPELGKALKESETVK